jgi:hypothetical protein
MSEMQLLKQFMGRSQIAQVFDARQVGVEIDAWCK